MNKTWTRIVIVVIAAAAVAFWVFFDRQRAPERQMDNALNAMPAWQVIKEQEPALHQRILDQMAALQKAGEPEQQIIDTIQPQILHLQMSRLQNAPDANVVNYMTINMEQTAAIQKVSDDACFRFLYPMVKGGINPMRMLDKDLMARRMQADADMMRAAYGKNRHTVTPAEREAAVEDVRPIMKELADKYGEDIQLLQMPEKAAGKEKLSCDMVQDMWAKVLAMPEQKAARVIRLAVSELD
ncbi:TPA: topoisomerase II [Enterobacter hormaechei]|uniref:topoisomerase II n=1 Tax=Enterobacter cloacae complex TaxID=354276 RepID=UPI0010BE625D|nr:topoisomerase II [Enterobacter hormaechei]HCM9643182.1 topoisomerase II [Enterobacter hormaechei subsp. xiangfangensis]MCE1569013.1 topoisomerase II [Enterobacter hormaechei]MCM7251652.1 topoisomerase II [Enterobacter hormaechei]MCM7313573.1 topoisomerase II [Enterobacter hormaechei]MCM8176032.1 topoisomerase II [Enterobacter hormaechei]